MANTADLCVCAIVQSSFPAPSQEKMYLLMQKYSYLHFSVPCILDNNIYVQMSGVCMEIAIRSSKATQQLAATMAQIE